MGKKLLFDLLISSRKKNVILDNRAKKNRDCPRPIKVSQLPFLPCNLCYNKIAS